ncbi:MAG: DUF6655 family protein [Gemmataceae bacterium]
MRRLTCWLAAVLLCGAVGCATQKESHTPRTGIEQLLISSAIDQSLDRVDLAPLKGRTVFLETKYLDCVDKNYIIVSMHHRLMGIGARLADKPEAASAVVEVVSGGVGTDSEELFVGVPEIPLPPPSPISVPKLGLFTRHKLNGTAKLLVLAYDSKTRAPIFDSSTTMARSDHNTWSFLGTGSVTTGNVPEQIATATGDLDFNVLSATQYAKRTVMPASAAPAKGGTPTPATTPDIQAVGHKKAE